MNFEDELLIKKLREEVQELQAMIATLDQENRQLNARNARLESELVAAKLEGGNH